MDVALTRGARLHARVHLDLVRRLASSMSRVAVAAQIANWTDVRTRRVEAGRGRGLGTNHVHHVVNEYDEPAYSVHAYSPRLYGMTRYTWRDDTLVLAGLEADTAP